MKHKTFESFVNERTELYPEYGIKELRDRLTIEDLQRNYEWILEADISGAVIGKRDPHLIWYDGVWENGTWENGTWEGGEWKDRRNPHPNER
jgi:hypothetical protein